ncbi:MATE family efflux transporter [Streptomyces meridianus]|uniref:Probable multidrug resistance protein NorM n=1 Tax=Streptomyces meridianus TaxID=2938945 RepID=A0ABT0X906_9ACTN|nr:MATE family efflux transporter [Streptomyces meridianus]MCM2579012.1 MATE family efflux transporter [Streptomyces meridianus]
MSDERSVFRTVVRAAAPLYLTTLAASAGALVDTALLGRHATVSLAAFAVTLAVFGPATATVAGALRGVMPFVAPHRDAPEGLLPLVRSGMWLAFGVGGVCAATVAAVPLIGRVSGVDRAALLQLGAFPWMLAGSVLLIAVGSSAASVLVALGHSARVMRAGLLGTAASVALSVLLVGGPGPLPGLGLTGAGIAMLASSLISAVLNQVALRRDAVPAGLPLGPGRPDVRQILRLAAVGVPLAGTVLVKFSVLGVLTFAAARLGTGSAAVHSVSESLVNVLFTVAVAVGQAVVPLIARSAAEGDVEGVRRSMWAGVRVVLCAVTVLGTLLLTAGGPVAGLFTEDPAVARQVAGLLPLVLVVLVGDALQAVAGFALVGLKRSGPSLVSTLVWFGGLAAVAVPVADTTGLTGLWMALACANLLQAVTKTVSFLRHGDRVRAAEAAGAVPVPAGGVPVPEAGGRHVR